jgi:mRNA interferase RelE/StbE
MPSSFELRVDPSARRSLQQMPERIAAAAAEFITGRLLENPYRVGGDLTRDLAGYRSARLGEYRIIYRIVEEQRLVRVLRIEHRSEVYRPR